MIDDTVLRKNGAASFVDFPRIRFFGIWKKNFNLVSQIKNIILDMKHKIAKLCGRNFCGLNNNNNKVAIGSEDDLISNDSIGLSRTFKSSEQRLKTNIDVDNIMII